MTPQELKNSILQLAIQGKLVEQRPEEGTANEMYKKLIIKKHIDLKPINDDEIPFEIPNSWMWFRHNELFEIIGGSQPPKSHFSNEYKEGYIRLYQIRDYGENPVPVYVPKNEVSKFSVKGDILLARYGGSLGKVFWAKDGAYNVALAKVTPLFEGEGPLPQYMYYYYNAPLYQLLVKNNSRSAQAGFNKEDLNNLLLPLPPLAEQKRIVAKIEELLPYIERYEKAWSKLEDLNKRFPTDLQKSILQLAIQGKLVEQRPEEGTAEELYQQIQAEKQRLIKEGKIKKEKPLPEITEDEIPFDIPESWKWVYIGDLFQHNTGKALNSSDKSGIPLEYITTSNVYWNRFELGKLKTMLFTDAEIEKCTVQKGDLLVLEGGDIGRAAIWNYDFPMRIQNHIHRLRPFNEICIEFFYYIFFLYKNAGLINGKGIGIQGLSSKVLHKLAVPLPPLAEQKRIVAKLEEILPLCEKLKLGEFLWPVKKLKQL
jgi:type I restriction enzyme, S subunit